MNEVFDKPSEAVVVSFSGLAHKSAPMFTVKPENAPSGIVSVHLAEIDV